MSHESNTLGHGEDGDVRIDPKALITTKALIMANSGGGKSYLMRKLLEQLGATAQMFVLDMEGEFVTLREKLDMVIVGPGGEIPADVRSAGLLVRRLMEKNISAVIDMSEMRAHDRRHFVRIFCETLIEMPKSLWRPLFVALDEAHQFAPEKGQGEAESTQAVIDLCTLGRKRGYCAILATQRISTLHKTAAGECNNKFIGRMALKNDLERAAFDLGVSSTEAKTMLRDLSPGEFYGFGPALTPAGVTRLTVGKVVTTHPKAGQGNTLTPPKPSSAIAAVAAELSDLPKQAEAEIKDLAAAKAKIADLDRQLKAKPVPPAPVAAKERIVEKLIVSDKQLARIESLTKRIDEALPKVGVELERVAARQAALKAIGDQLAGDVQILHQAIAAARNQPVTPALPNKAAGLTRAPVALSRAAVPGSAPDWMRPAHVRLLNALAWLESMGQSGWDRSVVAAMAGVSHKSSSFGNDLSRLSANGYVMYPSAGDVALTEVGRTAATAPAQKPTLADVHAAWRNCPALRPAHVRLMDVLITHNPNDLTRAELAEYVGCSPASSSFGNDLSRLSAMGLAHYPSPGRVAAGSLLFPAGLT